MASDTIQKRRPKQNIISTILAKGYSSVSSAGSSFIGSSGKVGVTTTKGGGRELVSKKTNSKTEGSSGSSTTANSSTTSTSNQLKRDILKSAVELTRRSQMKLTSNTMRRVRSQSRSSRKKHIFTKGERAFYRSDKGIVKVTIVGVHHDSKLVPYYTVQLRDGKEKQTDGKLLSPVVTAAPKDSVSNDKKKDEDEAQTSSITRSVSPGKRSIRSRSAPPSEIDSPDLGVALTVTDHDMTESSCSERKIVKLDEYHETTTSMEKNTDGEGGKPELSYPKKNKIASQEVENNGETLQKKFLIGGVAYYRPPGDMSSVTKVRIVKHSKSKGLYTISLPDGSHQDFVKSTQLATLMELSSNEMIALMKESGSKSRDTTKSSSTKNKSPSTTEKTPDINDEEVNVDAGYEAGEGEPMSSGSEDSKSLSQQQSNSSHTVPVSIPTTALVLPPKMRTVQAKTESGEWKSVPYYEKGMSLYYMNAEGVQKCKVLSVDLDDLMEPYYTILLDKDKKEKQTDNAHLALSSEEEMLEALQDQAEEKCNSVDKEEEQRCKGNQEKEEKDSSNSRLTRSSSKSPRSSSETNQQSSYATHPLSPSKNGPEENLAISNDKATQEEEEEEEALAFIPATFFKDDQVLYKNSEGERLRAVVLSLKRDKKNRPYYVVRILHSGLDKLVYGHRLRPLPENRSSSRSRSRGRSVSSKGEQPNPESSSRGGRSSSKGVSTRRSPSREKPMQLEKALNRITKQSYDSRGSGRGEESRGSSRHTRRSTLDSMDSNPSRRSESKHSVRSALSNSSRRSHQVRERKENNSRTRDNSVDSRRHNKDLDVSRGRKESKPNDPVGTSRSRRTGERSLSRSSRAPSADSRCMGKRSSRAPSADSRVSTLTSSTVGTKLSHSSCRRATSASSSKKTNMDDSIREGSVRGSNDNLSQVSSSVTAISKLKSFRKSFGLKKSSK